MYRDPSITALENELAEAKALNAYLEQENEKLRGLLRLSLNQEVLPGEEKKVSIFGRVSTWWKSKSPLDSDEFFEQLDEAEQFKEDSKYYEKYFQLEKLKEELSRFKPPIPPVDG